MVVLSPCWLAGPAGWDVSQVYVVFNGNSDVSALQKRIRRSQHARKETEFLRLKRTRLGLEDFESLKVIGRGAFGEVKTHKT